MLTATNGDHNRFERAAKRMRRIYLRQIRPGAQNFRCFSRLGHFAHCAEILAHRRNRHKLLKRPTRLDGRPAEYVPKLAEYRPPDNLCTNPVDFLYT